MLQRLTFWFTYYVFSPYVMKQAYRKCSNTGLYSICGRSLTLANVFNRYNVTNQNTRPALLKEYGMHNIINNFVV